MSFGSRKSTNHFEKKQNGINFIFEPPNARDALHSLINDNEKSERKSHSKKVIITGNFKTKNESFKWRWKTKKPGKSGFRIVSIVFTFLWGREGMENCNRRIEIWIDFNYQLEWCDLHPSPNVNRKSWLNWCMLQSQDRQRPQKASIIIIIISTYVLDAHSNKAFLS